MESLKIIEIEKLCGHPKNPREDVGDVTELAESIKSQGLMQNLTVVKGHYMTRKEYIDEVKAEGGTAGAASLAFDEMPWEETFCDDFDFYTVIIGHRRLAAAKLAGIEALPCNIVDLTPDEQVAMMISENMQRNDLTVTEQAYGCQLMFDLGFGAPQIAEKTGLNKSTVYHRLNLAKLDRKVLKAKEADESWQFSIKDLYVLEQVEDIDMRNVILKNATSSNNLRYLAENEVRKVKEKKNEEIIARLLEAKGIKFSDDYERYYYKETYKYIQGYKLDGMYDDNFIINIDTSEGEYVWRHGYGEIAVAKVVEVEEKPKEKTEWEIREEKRKELSQIADRIKDNMYSLIAKIINEDMKASHKETEDRIISILWETLTKMPKPVIIRGVLIGVYAEMSGTITSEDDGAQAENNFSSLTIRNQMFVALASEVTGLSVTYWDAKPVKENCDRLCFIHHLLAEYGFDLTKEEKQVIHGTHELYTKE